MKSRRRIGRTIDVWHLATHQLSEQAAGLRPGGEADMMMAKAEKGPVKARDRANHWD